MDQNDKVKIKLLRNAKGSDDGFSVRHFEKDEEATVSEALADALIAEGSAEHAGGSAGKKAKSGDQDTGPKAGDVVEKDGKTFFARENADVEAGFDLVPVDQLADDEREALIKDNKLTPEGKAVSGAPSNKALKGAPSNKALKGAPSNKAK